MIDVKPCSKNNQKSNDQNYICNVFTGRWVQKQGKLGKLVSLKNQKIKKKCKDKKNNLICNPLTGKLIKIGGPTHVNITKLQVKVNQSNQSEFYSGQKITYVMDGVYFKATMLEIVEGYILHKLEKDDNPQEILQQYINDPQKYTYNTLTGYDQNMISNFACSMENMNESNCTQNDICQWTSKTCQLKPNVQLKLGDIIKLYPYSSYSIEDDPEDHLIVSIYDLYKIQLDKNTEIVIAELSEIQEDIQLDQLACNQITALIHGTYDEGLLAILSNNKIEAKISPMGMGTAAVSTYPLLNCDVNHKLPLWNMWGSNHIFLDKSIIEENQNWRLSIKTDIGALKSSMPYTESNLHKYFIEISPDRYHVWSDINFDETLFTNNAGELAFFSDINNIKKYIKFVTINNQKKDLIKNVQSHGIKVIPLEGSEEFLVKSSFFK